MRQKTVHLNTEAETVALGTCIARELLPGMKFYLYGDLGSGKTTLTRAMLKALGVEDNVKSPTYALAEQYTVSIHGKPAMLMHFDLFRLGDAEEFIDAGFPEHFDDDTICIVEWPEKAAGVLPEPDIDGVFLIVGMGRRLTLHGRTERGAEAVGRICLEP